jgi:hypothetical protein
MAFHMDRIGVTGTMSETSKVFDDLETAVKNNTAVPNPTMFGLLPSANRDVSTEGIAKEALDMLKAIEAEEYDEAVLL